MSNSNGKYSQLDDSKNKMDESSNREELLDPEHYRVSDTVTHSTPEQTAAYLAEMLRELQDMAEKSGHSSLGEMLEFAHREAIWRSRESSGETTKRDEI